MKTKKLFTDQFKEIKREHWLSIPQQHLVASVLNRDDKPIILCLGQFFSYVFSSPKVHAILTICTNWHHGMCRGDTWPLRTEAQLLTYFINSWQASD